ncbi:hypothetical protein [Bacillus suaedaesalsae]|nr:hypothetical protein [Bacillus suaedaesalsae]
MNDELIQEMNLLLEQEEKNLTPAGKERLEQLLEALNQTDI